MKKERFDAITDAVLAIIITLMVLEIKLPELTSANIHKFLVQIFICAVSFTAITILWLNHHTMFTHVEKIDRRTIVLPFLSFRTSTYSITLSNKSKYFNNSRYILNFFFLPLNHENLFITFARSGAKRDTGNSGNH